MAWIGRSVKKLKRKEDTRKGRKAKSSEAKKKKCILLRQGREPRKLTSLLSVLIFSPFSLCVSVCLPVDKTETDGGHNDGFSD